MVDRVERKPITVGELIAKLQRYDPNVLVDVGGCDCVGEACDTKLASEYYTGIYADPDSIKVIITRTDGG